MRGRKGKCHVCGEVFPIELKQLELSGDESAPSNSGVHQVANEQIGSGSPKALSSTGAVRSAAIRLSCPACSCLMEVPPSAAGMQALCPQCNQLLEIPSDPRPDDGRTQANSASQPGSDKGNNPFLAPSPAPLRTSTKTVAPSQAPPSTQAARPLRKPESASEPTTFAPSGSNDFFGQDFGDLDNALPTNAYLAPTMASQDSWLVPIAGLVNRNLSFSNAFSLLFERSFPACLIAPALFLNAALFAMGLIYLAGLIVEQAGELSANRRLLAVGVSLILSVPIWTATVCMTCNTALSALRQRELPASVLFGTGKIYGGVLILMIGWTLLLAAQLFLPSLVAFGFTSIGLQHLAGVSAIGILVLLVILQLAVQMFFGFTPFAMLDGHGFLGSVQISLSICGRNFLTVLGTTICGWLLFTAIAFVSCGVGAVLLIGIMFFLQAAMYLLARGDG
ncbi:MAG: hypothetical protein KDB22_19690 [Planctomycetales bacterium]|nr:hypothetical protein [Planctomycetales bacterium]